MPNQSLLEKRYPSSLRCCFLTYLVSYPAAALIALAFRFPIPLGGYYSGVEAVIPSLIAVAFYSMFGLLPALLLCGAIAGIFVPPKRSGSGLLPSKLEAELSVVAALVPLGVLSILDKIIGPW
jgi:hypothetical protein